MHSRTIATMILVTLSGIASHSQAVDHDPPELSDVFVRAVGNQLGIEGNVFTEEQLSSVTELEIKYAGRIDLTQLAHFPKLQKLVLRGNFISDLTPLSTLVHLKYLNLSDNRISDLTPLKSLTALTYLNLNTNLIVDCSPLAGLSKLRALRLNANATEELTPLSTLSRLESLHADENRITQLEGIQALGQLKDLRVSRNGIVDLAPMSTLVDLTEFSADQNRIENLVPLEGLTNLKSLSVRQNPVRSIAPLKNLTRLAKLSLESSRFDGDLAPLNRLTNLAELTMAKSHVRNIEPLRGLQKLARLNLRYNDIEDIHPLIQSRAPFKTINLDGNPLGTLARTVHVQALRRKTKVTISGSLFASSTALHTNFIDIDQNHDDLLSYKEVQSRFAKLDLKEFDAIDVNRDWAISLDELANLIVILSNSMDLVWVGGKESPTALGTKDSPFGSLEKAVDAVKQGGTIILAPGTTLTGKTLSEPMTLTVPKGPKGPGRIVGANNPPDTPTPVPEKKSTTKTSPRN